MSQTREIKLENFKRRLRIASLIVVFFIFSAIAYHYIFIAKG